MQDDTEESTVRRRLARQRGGIPIVIALIALVAAVALAGCGGSSGGESSGGTTGGGSETSAEGGGSSTIRVALVQAATANLPVEIADAEGLFEKQGLEVTVDTPNIPFSQLPAALGKQYDLVIGTEPGLITAADSGIDIMAVSGLQRDNPKDPGAALVVPEGSSITGIKDLGGKSVGAPSTVGNNFSALECWARKEGVDPSSIRGLEAATPQIPELLEAGRFESALLFEPLLKPLVEGGSTDLGNAYQECFGEPSQYTSLWLAQGSWAEENSVAIGKFLAALEEAQGVMEKDPEGSRAIYVKTSGLPPEAAENTPIIPGEFDFQQGQPIVENIETWIKVLEENGTFEGSVEPSALVLEG
jgi:NitT/TauT family transport system substrate-binding protein